MHLVVDGTPTQSVNRLALHAWLTIAPERLGFTRIQPAQVEDTGTALMGYVLLAESHISAHFYWEQQVAHFDAFTCAEFEPEMFLAMVGELGVEIARTGLVPSRGLEYLPRSTP